MKRKDRLKDVIRAAAEFHERRLWKRFNNDDCFAVKVAGEKAPLLACGMGAAGEEYGLILLRGRRAAEHLQSILLPEGSGDDTREEVDMLSFSMDAFGDLEPPSQALFRQAGIYPRRDDRVPCILVKRPGRQPRVPNDAELVLLQKVLKIVMAADRRKLLKPAGLDDPKGICVVTPGGDPKDPTVSVNRERLSRPSPQPEGGDSTITPRDLRGLGPLNATVVWWRHSGAVG